MSRAQAAPRAHSAATHREQRPRRARDAGRATDARRRQRHYARRRRDLLFDCLGGLTLALILMAMTAGLGVLALVLIPLVAGLGIAALVRRGVPQRMYAAWRAFRARRLDGRPAARRDARQRPTRQRPSSAPAAHRPAAPRPVWEQMAGDWAEEPAWRPAEAVRRRR